MTRYLRYFRIAFSAFCGITAVLLVVLLWVRSYWWWDIETKQSYCTFASVKGEFGCDCPSSGFRNGRWSGQRFNCRIVCP